MCDTLGHIGQARSFFAKNSDRSPNEAQVTEYHPARDGLSGNVDCTYISIPQVAHTHAVLLSRPAWMWGAEMGVNEFGLCIGNEAVFTKGGYGKTGLTGMDMVRLALERSRTAQEALHLLISLLETYGQGGDCGFDHDFYYDNAFLIMDRQALYVLETAGKEWVYRRSQAANISNRLSIAGDFHRCSLKDCPDFQKRFTEPVFTAFSGSARRMAQVRGCLDGATTVGGCIHALTRHDSSVKNPFARGSVSSACMHFGGLVGDHTTASMVVSLDENRTVVWTTGSSLPCVSLFKPWLMGTEEVLPIVPAGGGAASRYWLQAEQFRRQLLGYQLPAAFYEEKDAIQRRWEALAEQTKDADFPALSRACLAEEAVFFAKWASQPLPKASTTLAFRHRWHKKTQALHFGD